MGMMDEKRKNAPSAPEDPAALGRKLGRELEIASRGGTAAVLRDLGELEKDLERRREACRGDASPAAEWLLDNFYLVRRDLGRVREALRGKKSLPRLRDGRLRILALLEALPENCGRVDGPCLRAFLEGCGETASLEEGELALGEAALRLALLKRLLARPDSAEGVFTGLRALDALEFSALLAEVSPLERILRRDPAGVYPRMDPESRGEYRRQVSRLARQSGLGETETADRALTLAAERGEHVGKYLYVRPLGKPGKRPRPGLYFAACLLPALALAVCIARAADGYFAGILTLLPLLEGVKYIVDRILTRLCKPARLPRLDYSRGIPRESRTLGMTVLLLRSPEEAREAVRRLEGFRLANRDAGENLTLGILADLRESRTQREDGDEAVLRAAAEEVDRLNRKYGGGFCLLCRDRSYSKRDRVWRGWERKRGAILDLLALLHGEESRAACRAGDSACLEGIRYLLVLDGDTNLTPGMAAKLAGTLAHPLQRAELDVEKHRVVSGCGILQPRVSVSLEDADRSDFARVFAGRGGLDPYGGPCSELYQDLFREGSYIGKGLLDAEAAWVCLRGRFPMDRLLSHDLVEGAFLGCAFAGDLELSDGFPGSLLSYYERQHRWIRGDWQTLPWLLPRVRNEAGEWEKNPMSPLSKWKILENLRRSLLPPAVFLSLFLYGLLGTRILLLAAGVSVVSLGLKVVLDTAGSRPGGRRYRGRAFTGPVSQLLQLLLLLLLLPYSAWVQLSAVLTALWRMLVSKRGLLQWVTAAESGAKKNGLRAYFRRMFPCTAAGLLGLLGRSPAMLALSVLWLLTPLLGWAISRERRGLPRPGEEERVFLLHTAGDMWRYFQRFLTPERHFLPPDNLQEEPEEETAERVSPTNAGLSLLAPLAALDLGLTDRETAFTLASHILDTLEALPKFRGHLLNWYDIPTLTPLEPPYVSTVDSGNLLACLYTLAGAAEEAGETDLARRARALGEAMPLDFLYDGERKLLRIGWDPRTDKPSGGWYDLLESEARIASFLAVARGEADLAHWRRLGRVFTGSRGRYGLASWTGTMFEYFMPELFLPAYPGSLLWESGRFCVEQQRRAACGGVWGKSESGCARMDAGAHYAYQAHGVQALALKRGMDREKVVAPYASFLALMRCPGPAVKNLRRLRALGAEGICGFYEAADFGVPGEGPAVVKSFMVHHLAMSLLAVDNVLCNGAMRRRFLAEPALGAYTDLLRERSPVGERIRPTGECRLDEKPERPSLEGWSLCRTGYDLASPALLPLSNGGYHLLVSELGASRGLWEGRLTAVSSFHRFSQGQGVLCFASAGGRFFSLQPAPEYDGATEYHWEYDGTRFCGHAAREGWQFRTEVRLPRHAPGELRKLTVTNRTGEWQEVTLALYFEPALCTPAAWDSHPAFARLALETRLREGCLVVHRRPGGREEEAACAVGCSEACQWETDRQALFGRGGLRAMPAALLRRGSSIRDSQDPCVLGRVRLTLKPGEKRTLTFALALGRTPGEAFTALGEVRRGAGEDTRFARNARAFGLEGGELERALGLLTPLFYSTAGVRAQRENYARWDRGPDGLWQYGISGDLPVAAPGQETPERMLRAWALLRSMGVPFDLALPVEDEGVYGRPECAAILDLAEKLGVSGALGQKGGFHLAGGGPEDRMALLARCRIQGLPRTERSTAAHGTAPWFLPLRAENREERRELSQGNPWVFRTEKGVGLRAWSHVLTNGHMGWLATDAGTGNLFLENAREGQITPWENDPLSLWGPERLELLQGGERRSLFGDADGCPTEVEYGFGWARWRRWLGRTETELTAFLPREARCLVLDLRLRGQAADARVRFFARLAETAPGDLGLFTQAPVLMETGDELTWMTGTAAGGDDCIAAELAAGERLVLVLGLPAGEAYAEPTRAEAELERVRARWEELCGAVRVESPSPRLDAYLNGWGLYQTLACRLLGRCSLYQSGGAYGFRDQLQDVCALADTLPEAARAQILLAAAHQYREGDVMHWWHPHPAGDKGVRTRCSDDLLWLPYALTVYGEKTGDRRILGETAPWLASEPLRPEERDRYETPARMGAGSLEDHCLAAIRLVLNRGTGPHGLLPMGSGDWNDGMDAVEGESVWLTWFAALVLDRFGAFTGREDLREKAAELGRSADGAWCGDRYLRGWYGDGRPLGKGGSQECALDSLSQSFAVLSGFGDPERSRAAVVKAAYTLLDGEHGLVKLFTPPFNGLEKPGYIRSYLPGVRENGGQYTHAAVWLAAACLRCGERELGWTLLETLLPSQRPEAVYQGEPYVLAADVYAHPDMPGRAGWTWYTGAAGWLLRTALEELLGLRLAAGKLRAEPRLPEAWPGYTARLRLGDRVWQIRAERGKAPEVREEKPGENVASGREDVV